MDDLIRIRGELEIIIEDRGIITKTPWLSNTVLLSGKSAVVRTLGYDIGSSFQYYIDKMMFGDGGEESGVPKSVPPTRTSLFGDARATLSVAPSFSPDVKNQVVFTSVLTESNAVGYTLNEAALQMADGNLFSLITFSGLPKTDTMRLTFNWKVSVI